VVLTVHHLPDIKNPLLGNNEYHQVQNLDLQSLYSAFGYEPKPT
jgi:hypothetical protein